MCVNVYGNFLTHSFYDLSVKGLASPMISSAGSYTWQSFKVCTAYATCGLLELVCEMCLLYIVYYVLWARTA